jgi:signal peptidase II
VVRFTLAYNPGMAFSFDIRPYVGDWARPIFILVAIVILAILARVYRRASPSARLIAVALALVAGGAIGNAMDRVRARPGVVDFIDVGVGAHRFGIFNIADAGITVGAVLLAFILMREDRESRLRQPAA